MNDLPRCDVCGSQTTKTSIPVFEETLRACERCRKGIWRTLKEDMEE